MPTSGHGMPCPYAFRCSVHATNFALLMPATFVFSTFGARGDVFPYLSIALELQKRGHHPIIATAESFRAEVEALGLEFRPMRPDSPRGDDARRAMHPISGLEFVLRRWLLPALRESIADLRAVIQQEKAAVLVSHTLSLAAPIVAELEQGRGLKWVSGAVSPLVLFPPDSALPFWPRGADFPRLNAVLMALLKRQIGMQLKPVQHLRADLGLARGDNALWSDAHSPLLQLALWDACFAPVAASKTRRATGFCALKSEAALDSALTSFLEVGEPPLLFVAASHAQSAAWEQQSLRAAQILGHRALLLGTAASRDSETVLQRPFAPLDSLLPRVAALIHAGGIGTLSRGLDFAVPMLLAPRAHDQFDNARRAEKLGLARVLTTRNEEKSEFVAREIGALLDDAELKQRLKKWQAQPSNGARNAADALEKVL